jgi:hypothetical protein
MGWLDKTCDWCGLHTSNLPYKYVWSYFCSAACEDNWRRAHGKDAASLAAEDRRQEERKRQAEQQRQQKEQEVAGEVTRRREYLQRIESGGGNSLNDAFASLVRASGLAPAKQEQAAPLPDVPPPLPAKATRPEDFIADVGEWTPRGGALIKGVEITGLKNKAVKIALVPDKIEGMPVIGIGEYLFQDCRELKMVKLPDSVVIIKQAAFADCVSLASVNLPSSLDVIFKGAFFGCRSLSSIIFPQKMAQILDSAFMGCRSLSSIELPSLKDGYGNFQIGEQAFEGCERLSSIRLPQRVEFVKFATGGYWPGNSYGFKGCTALSLAEKQKLRDAGYKGEI